MTKWASTKRHWRSRTKKMGVQMHNQPPPCVCAWSSVRRRKRARDGGRCRRQGCGCTRTRPSWRNQTGSCTPKHMHANRREGGEQPQNQHEQCTCKACRGRGREEGQGEKEGRRRVATHKHRYTDTQIHAARVVEHQVPCHERAAMEIGREHKRV